MVKSLDDTLIIKYFNDLASSWDNIVKIDKEKLDCIFNKGSYLSNASLLDIGCGTGILFDYYMSSNVKSIVGIDISSKMIDIAKSKYNNINLICGNAINYDFKEKFDVIVIYNTLPHISDVDALLLNCKKHLNENGKLIIAFGQSQEDTNRMHDDIPAGVSSYLMNIEMLEIKCLKYFDMCMFDSSIDIYEIICTNRV